MRQEGKIHGKLVNTVRIMSVIAVIIGGIEVYEMIFGGETIWIAALLAAGGLLVGWYLFAPLNAAEWNEEKELVAARRIDWVGFAAIGAYIALVIVLGIFLNQNFPAQTTILVLAFVFGMLGGRLLGTIVEIHRAFRAAHS